jgi:2-keto-4-pentenoate hydratase/2-oxohepta-3-ene-1,7-dioic acid hydratase in catechol pathway
MKLVTYSNGSSEPRIGAVVDDSVIDLGGIAPDMRTFFEGGEETMEAARGEVDKGSAAAALDDVKLHAPIAPKKFFHTAGNFREHHEESQSVGFSHPVNPWIIFFQNVDAIIGPDEPVVYPSHLTSELDYELELAVVLSKPGAHFDAEEASDYIGGYVIFNDITARDIQRKEMESGIFSFCKAIDTFCPLGPWIVTPDELPDVSKLEMRLRVNGEERQNSNMANISFSVPEILAHYAPLGFSAGDVLSTGTVSGVAGFQEDPQAWYLKPGDVVEAEIEGIGVLRNPIIAWEDSHGGPPPAPVGSGVSA